jgi:Zn-finger protein
MGRDYVEETIRSGKLRGPDRTCPYYPCHREGHDCTWCFCPFYPCLDESKGGLWVKNSQTGKTVWSCKGCEWIHEPKIAERVLAELLKVRNKPGAPNRSQLLRILRRISEEDRGK